jgi:hypothetical protein
MNNGEHEGLEFLPRVWMVLVAFASTGGLADYLIQMRRGLKPEKTLGQMLIAGCIHVFIAAVVGALCALLSLALGHAQWYELGLSAGGGGMMGARAFEVAMVYLRSKGIDVEKKRVRR